eukprot:1475330-Amphidinium_carterae.3
MALGKATPVDGAASAKSPSCGCSSVSIGCVACKKAAANAWGVLQGSLAYVMLIEVLLLWSSVGWRGRGTSPSALGAVDNCVFDVLSCIASTHRRRTSWGRQNVGR